MEVDNYLWIKPRDAVKVLEDRFLKHVIPAFINGDKNGVLERARRHKMENSTRMNIYAYVDGN